MKRSPAMRVGVIPTTHLDQAGDHAAPREPSICGRPDAFIDFDRFLEQLHGPT